MTNFMKPPRPPAKGCKSVSRFYQRLLFVIAILASEASVANCQLVLSQPRVDFGILRHAQWLDGPASSPSLGKRTVVLNVVCVAIALSGVDLHQFLLALFALGVGWNFLFTGSTTLALTAYRPEEKDRAQAAINFCVFATMAFTSFASGALVTTQGWMWLNLGSLPALALVGGALAWLGWRGRQTALRAAD